MGAESMLERFHGKVALVTGGGSGIGRAGVIRFAQEGADVTVVDRVGDRAQVVAREISALGRRALAVTADVSVQADAERMVAETLDHFGRLDCMFNNAGIGGESAAVLDMPVEEWRNVIAVNLTGMFFSCKYGVAALIRTGGGAIVNMSSDMAGWDTLGESAPYMASKEGVLALTKALALEVAGEGIRVNAVCPGIIETRLSFEQGDSGAEMDEYFGQFRKRIPLRRVGQPEEVAAAVAFLASDDARHITGSALLIDGGQTLQSWSNAPEGDAYPLYLQAKRK
jgi:NAD(P)-dependent dehydrogenase (short-subunit alcohol dehydrogenase family)